MNSMVSDRFIPYEEQYKRYLKDNPIKKLTDSDIKKLDTTLKKRILKELSVTSEHDIQEFMLEHKWHEIQEFVKNTEPELIEEVEDLIWKPKGRSDYRRLKPELILTSNTIEIKKKTIWGDEYYQEYLQDEKLVRHTTILRTLIASSRHDSVVGRQLRYLVRDKVTKKYLGVICIASSFMNLSVRNTEVFGGKCYFDKEDFKKRYLTYRKKKLKQELTQKGLEITTEVMDKIRSSRIDKEDYQKWLEQDSEYKKYLKAKQNFKEAFKPKTGRSLHMANGQSIMCTQPFGRNFNGGKFLALMCLSKQVADDWKHRYGDTLVSIDTTSLYGGVKGSSQYDGLRPYWENLGETSGEGVPLKPSDSLWLAMRKWVKKRYPEIFFKHRYAKNEKGQPVVRDTKNALINVVYSKLGIKREINTSSGHKRGVYYANLYKNTNKFLRGEIEEKELIPAFDNNVDTLVEFWKFGFEGDTKKGGIHPEIAKLYNDKYRLEKLSSAKQRLKKQIDRGEDEINLVTDWYLPMANMSLEDTLKTYHSYVGR